MLVDTLWCDAWRKNEAKIIGMKNYSSSWVKGTTNHKTSNVTDHATSDQHKAAMIHVKKASNQPLKTYSPIACSLLTMDETTQKRMKRKFDINFVMSWQRRAWLLKNTLLSMAMKNDMALTLDKLTKPINLSPITSLKVNARISLPRFQETLGFTASSWTAPQTLETLKMSWW